MSKHILEDGTEVEVTEEGLEIAQPAQTVNKDLLTERRKSHVYQRDFHDAEIIKIDELLTFLEK